MGAHLRNPVAIANSAPKVDVNVMPLGELEGVKYGLLGVSLQPAVDKDGNLRVLLTASCARVSDLVPIGMGDVTQVVLGSLGGLPVSGLLEKISAALSPKPSLEVVPA